MACPVCGLARIFLFETWKRSGDNNDAVAEHGVEGGASEVAGRASDDTATESALCVVCVFWNNIVALCFE